MLHTSGFTTNPSKTIGPCTYLELLGIVLDSVAQEAPIYSCLGALANHAQSDNSNRLQGN